MGYKKSTILVFSCYIAFILLRAVGANVVSFNKNEQSEVKVGYAKGEKLKTCVPPDNYKRKPLVMVPGVLGSQLEGKLDKQNVPYYFCEKKSDWYSLWLNLEQLLPLVVDCWVDNIKMVYNNVTRKVKDSPGVNTRVPHFGTTTAFDYLDQDKYAVGSPYFSPLVDYMTCNLGYRKKKDLFGAPYDWRIAPYQHGDFFKNLTSLIEKAYYSNNNQKVVILGHSMGNMFIYYMLQRKSPAWKDKFVDSFVSISSPYLGSVKAVKALTSGETEGHDWALPVLKLRNVVRTASAFAFMLPRPDLWPENKKTIVVTLGKNYTVHDYKELFERIDCEWCWDMWKDNGMALGSLSAPSVPVHCIYSSQTPTAETLIYDEVIFPDDSPSLVDGSGDGTVNVWSGSACLKWKDEQKQPVHKVELPGNTHVQILWNSTLHYYLKGVVLR
ncbi:lysosomal phospholipase A and acyltransferase-like [Clavelina lepadiformis]|uniref:lysosomal phospholipase A and acyltransferase-like n=1 Tax=Clavelina lepadiformis TaxID=159417 RepID=UPI00404186CF